MTQTERVLRALQRAGDRGVTQVDFLLPDVIDGGPPITRLAARVKDARDGGYGIVVAGERDQCVVYRLVSSGVVSAPAPPASAHLAGAPDRGGRTSPSAHLSSPDGAGADSTPDGQLFDTLSMEFDQMVTRSPFDVEAA